MRQLIPMACTLPGPEANDRIDDWYQTLQCLTIDVERPRPQQLRLALANDAALIGALIRLAKAEKACCSFFDFTIDIAADTITFVIDVPPGSEAVLDDFARLAAPS
ncbi:MAG: hypothetical protein JO337_10720 [Acidimicrobiales bacterium]|nr:hypothetical protein [Acidimicrobiales bacterium]